MSDLLPPLPLPLLLAFVGAALVLAVTPGPGVVYIVTRTLHQGRGSGFASVAGVALGNLCNASAASIGVAAILAASAFAFDLVRYLGAAYLCWLGVQALRSGPLDTQVAVPPSSHRRVMGQGFLVALLNPKTTLFFAAFLPPFLEPTSAPIRQALALGAVFVVLAAASDAAYVLAASAVAPALRTSRGIAGLGRLLTAAVYVALGIHAAVSGARPPKG